MNEEELKNTSDHDLLLMMYRDMCWVKKILVGLIATLLGMSSTVVGILVKLLLVD